MTKICSKCKKEKSLTEFYKNSRIKSGYCSACKECYRSNYKKLLRKDPDYNKKSWQRHYSKPEMRDKHKKRSAEWIAENKEYHLASMKQWHRENKEYHLKLVRDWYNNTEKGKQQTKAKSQNRRQRERDAGHLSAAIIRIVEAENIEQFGKLTCVYCKKVIKKEYHLDHIVPLVKGGKNRKLNLCVACSSCNIKKGTMPATEFRRSMLKSI